jgi:hypothetical protein
MAVAVVLTAVAASGAVVAPAGAAALDPRATARLVRLPGPPNAGGYGLEIHVTHSVNAPMVEFQLGIDLPPGTIPSPWNYIAFTKSGDRYTMNYRSGSAQRAGETTMVSVTIFGTGDPTNCKINGRSACTYEVQTDPVPPTSPAPVTATRASGTSPWGPYAHIRVTWGRSTDNYRLQGYEVSANGQVILSTTNLSDSYLYDDYTTQQVVYSVRAFDSVGNFSTPATFVLPAL